MRIYRNFKEAHSEVLRDIVEMGILVRPKTMQNKDIEGNTDYETLELQNYIYTVTQPNREDLNPTQPWADAEFEERISWPPVNPGEAWKYRPEIWEEYLREVQDMAPQFDYTYSERFSDFEGLSNIIKRIKIDPDSRQLYLSVWDTMDILGLGVYRVPCSLGYLFQVRNNKLNMTYTMRSCDYITHFVNDVYLAYRLQEYVAKQTNCEIGNFTHFINSLHIYRKDSKGVF